MDIISLGDEQRALTSLQLLTSTSQTLMLDLENCSLQSGLWRSIFQGHIRLSLELISVGVGQSSSARVEQATRHVSPARINTRHTCIKTTVPSLLSPLLSDSPCTNNLHVRLPRKRTGQPAALEFSILATNHVTRHVISPLVDRGHVQTEHVSGLVSRYEIFLCIKYFRISRQLFPASSRVRRTTAVPETAPWSTPRRWSRSCLVNLPLDSDSWRSGMKCFLCLKYFRIYKQLFSERSWSRSCSTARPSRRARSWTMLVRNKDSS